MLKILVVNLGSTSTKVAYYEDQQEVFNDLIKHSTEEIQKGMIDQIPDRMSAIHHFLNEHAIASEDIDVISARGGLLKPIKGGTYEINSQMMEDVRTFKYGQHASNLSTLIGGEFKKRYGTKAFITDPVVVDELMDEVRMTGLKGIERVSIFHALNQKAVARKFAHSLDKNYDDINVIVVHMGGRYYGRCPQSRACR